MAGINLNTVHALRATDDNSAAVSGGKLYVYKAGTSTAVTTYSDAAMSTANAHPVVSDSAGAFGPVYVAAQMVKIDLTNSAGTSLPGYPIDNVNAGSLDDFSITVPGATASQDLDTRIGIELTPEDFGATGDGVADDLAELQALHDYCASNGVPYRYPGKTYHIGAGTLTIKSSGDASAATITATASNGGGTPTKAVVVGSTGTSDEIFRIRVLLPKVTNSSKTTTGWTGFDQSIGVEISNLYESVVINRMVRGFGFGIKMTSVDTGCVYNEIFIGTLQDNRKNLQIAPGGTTGWVNENTFIGGRYQHQSAEGTNVAGVMNIYIVDSTTSSPNNNVFLRPCIEGNVAAYHLWCEGGQNQFISGRYEASPCNVHFKGANSGDNMIVGGYNPQAITFSYGGVSNLEKRQLLLSPRQSIQGGTGVSLALTNTSSTGSTGRHIAGYDPAYDVLNTDATAADWRYLVYADGMEGKRSGDAHPRLRLDWTNNRIYMGDGLTAPVSVVGIQRAAIADDASGAANQATVNAILAALRGHGLIAT